MIKKNAYYTCTVRMKLFEKLQLKVQASFVYEVQFKCIKIKLKHNFINLGTVGNKRKRKDFISQINIQLLRYGKSELSQF